MCVLREIWGDKMVAEPAEMADFYTHTHTHTHTYKGFAEKNFIRPAKRMALCRLFCVRR